MVEQQFRDENENVSSTKSSISPLENKELLKCVCVCGGVCVSRALRIHHSASSRVSLPQGLPSRPGLQSIPLHSICPAQLRAFVYT